MQILEPGTPAPQFCLPDAYGRNVSLEKYRGRPVLLVFIRHLGSIFCRAHLSALRRQYGRIQHLGGEVLVISFENGGGLKKMIDAHKFPFVFLLDRERWVYRQYGMVYKEKGIAGLGTVVAYLKLRLSGYPKMRKGSHAGQMGGDVVVDGKGDIRFVYRSRFPEDRPAAEEIINQLSKHRR